MRTIALFAFLVGGLTAADFHIGPAQPFEEMTSFPWTTLNPGDVVNIHYRPEPYRTIVNLNRSGTAGSPITIRGVNGPNGEKPIVSAQNAVVADVATPGNTIRAYGVFVITSPAYRVSTKYITIENLKIQESGSILENFFLDVPTIGPLAEDLTATQTTVAVESASTHLPQGASSFYAANAFTIRYGTEHLKVLSRAGNVFTVTRAFNGTAAAAHTKSDPTWSNQIRAAASVYIYLGEHIVIKDNWFYRSGNCLFANSPASGGSDPLLMSRDILVTGNRFEECGVTGSGKQHGSYTETGGIVYEFNTFLAGKAGSNAITLKDRSAGTVIRYNYIECGNASYCLHLVSCENNGAICALPSYRETFVYGNVFVNQKQANGNLGAVNMMMYGQDNGPANDRAGTLYLYHNTFIQNDPQWWSKFIVKQTSLLSKMDFRNNLTVWTVPTSNYGGHTFSWFQAPGTVNFGVNWQNAGVKPTSAIATTVMTGAENIFTDATNTPGFVNMADKDYRLTLASTALNRTGPLAPAVTVNTLQQDLTPAFQYVYGGPPVVRLSLKDPGAASDISIAPPPPPPPPPPPALPDPTFTCQFQIGGKVGPDGEIFFRCVVQK
jgi:hypothetical protein